MGGCPYFTGIYGPPRVHIPLLNMDPGSIFRGGGHIQYDIGSSVAYEQQGAERPRAGRPTPALSRPTGGVAETSGCT